MMELDQDSMPEIYTKSELMRRVRDYLKLPTHLHVTAAERLLGVTTCQDFQNTRKVVYYYGIPTLYVYFNNSIKLIE